MMNDRYELNDGAMRDRRGRFRKGTSGNPCGRPRKQRPTSWTLQNSLIGALLEQVAVTGPNGEPTRMEMRDLLVKSALRDLLKAKPKDKIAILERWADRGLLEADEEPSETFTEEDRRLLEIVRQDVMVHICCTCEKPLLEGVRRTITDEGFLP